MEDKKKTFYTYVDALHKKYEEIHNVIQEKEKIKQNELQKIEQMKEKIKQNDVAILHLNNLNKNKELGYLAFQRETNIQKNRLDNLKSMLQEFPENINQEEEQYHNFKKQTDEDINNLLNSFEVLPNSTIIEETFKQIKESKEKTNELNESIQNTYKQIMEMKESYDKTKSDYQELLQMEKRQKKKLRKITTTLQFLENSSKEMKHQRSSDKDIILKNKLEKICTECYM